MSLIGVKSRGKKSPQIPDNKIAKSGWRPFTITIRRAALGASTIAKAKEAAPKISAPS